MCYALGLPLPYLYPLVAFAAYSLVACTTHYVCQPWLDSYQLRPQNRCAFQGTLSQVQSTPASYPRVSVKACSSLVPSQHYRHPWLGSPPSCLPTLDWQWYSGLCTVFINYPHRLLSHLAFTDSQPLPVRDKPLLQLPPLEAWALIWTGPRTRISRRATSCARLVLTLSP